MCIKPDKAYFRLWRHTFCHALPPLRAAKQTRVFLVHSGFGFDGFEVDFLEAFSWERRIDLADVLDVQLDAD